MEIGIIGFPLAGKTTLFTALTRGRGEAVRHGGALRPAVGVARVPEPRLQALARLFNPRRVVPAEVVYLDVPGGPEPGKGLGGEALNFLQRADALISVVRAFEDPGVPHPAGGVDPWRDIPAMDLELAFSDLGILERRLSRLEAGMKGARPHERGPLEREAALLRRLRASLEAEVPLREQSLSPDEVRLVSSFGLLTARPLLTVLNIGEADLPRAGELEALCRERFGRPGRAFLAVCARLEADLALMEPGEEAQFRRELGLGEVSGAERVVRASYDLLGMATFFTVVSGEVRAWAVPRGLPAVKAAGRIHSDMERGFIRAEVVPFEALVGAGSMAEARRRGQVRLEGRDYPVQDGDVITFRFNV